MSGLITQEGAYDDMQAITGQEQSTNRITCRLYTNNYTPAATSVFADFIEPTDGSYAPVQVPYGSWTLSLQADGAKAVANGLVFAFAAGGVVYGYFLSRTGTSRSQTGEKFGTSLTIPSTGGTITINVTIPLKTC